MRNWIIQCFIFLPAVTKLRKEFNRKSDMKLLFHFQWCEKKKKNDMAGLFQEVIYMSKEALFKLFDEQASRIQCVWPKFFLFSCVWTWTLEAFLCSDTCWLPILYCTTCYAEKNHHLEMRKRYYCLILKDLLKNFSSFSVTYSLLLKCPGFLCLFSTSHTKAVDGDD